MIAVDPTSPFTGGAVLGDRLRMQTHAADQGVFIRSMATRGHLGGLARATGDAALVLDAAGKDVILIETVGVGQDEVDIIRTADISVVTLVPGAGDDVQALKAGIMEIADIFVVNKADREGADRVVSEVEANLAAARTDPEEWRPPILKTTATTGAGRRRARRRDLDVPRAIGAGPGVRRGRLWRRGSAAASSIACASWCRSDSWIISSGRCLRRTSWPRSSSGSPRGSSIPTPPQTSCSLEPRRSIFDHEVTKGTKRGLCVDSTHDLIHQESLSDHGRPPWSLRVLCAVVVKADVL